METETQNDQKTKQNPSPLKEMGAFFWDLIKIVAIAVVVIFPIRTFIAEPFVVSGSSMVPNFHNNDYLIVDRMSYKLQEPQRGQIIVFRYPKDTKQYFIKRIIGLPGEKIEFSGGKVVIYNGQNPGGKILDEPYLPKNLETLGKSGTTSLGSEDYLVLGDNRMASSDSREWGILPKKDIIGKVWVRILPFKNFGIIPQSFSQTYAN